ncbi:50S ribosomal protein L2 [Candidatus Woesearchaeota archaeon]|nr:50S ribosomal protein L2 [Candidatus Woesearchaeota archaeon]
MGKNLIQQARGKGGPSYRARSFAYAGVARLRNVCNSCVSGRITDIIKSPGHAAPLIKVAFEDGVKCLMQAPEFVKIGDVLQAGPGAEISAGNIMLLKDIPEGTLVFNIESQPGDGGKFCRTGGCAARVLSKIKDKVNVLLPSKREKAFNLNCRACIGIPAGAGRKEKPFLKAGIVHHAKRSKNKRYPMISAAAQNAVDHPFGNSRSSRKAKNKAANKFAPPGRKVGKLWPKRSGMKK